MSSRLTLKAGIVEEFEFYGEDWRRRRGEATCVLLLCKVWHQWDLYTAREGANGVGMIVMVIGVCHEYSVTARTRHRAQKQTNI